MRLHVDHEFQDQVLEPIAEGDLRGGCESELLANTIGPIVGAAHIALDEVSGRRLYANPIITKIQRVDSLTLRNTFSQ